MADRLDELLAFWRRHGDSPARIRSNKVEIVAWEERYGVVLPDDLREYVLRVNGIAGGESLEFDHEGMSFLPLASMCTEGEWAENNISSNRFVFADMLIQCYWWCAELDKTPKKFTAVSLGGGLPGKNRLVASSLDEFLSLYMHNNRAIHFGK